MVDLTSLEDQERVAQIMGKKPESEALDPLRDLTPSYARIQVPLFDRRALDDCADLLSTLIAQLRILKGRHDMTQSQVLYYAWKEIQTANDRMKDSTRYRKQK